MHRFPAEAPTSNILLIGPYKGLASQLGATLVPDLESARSWTQVRNFAIVLFALDADYDEILVFNDHLKNHCRSAQIICSLKTTSSDSLPDSEVTNDQLELINIINPFKIVPGFDLEKLQSCLYAAAENYSQIQQQQSMIELYNEQNKRLAELGASLNSRIEKREDILARAKNKLLTTNNRSKAIHHALINLNASQSLSEVQQGLVNSLSKSFNLQSVVVVLDSPMNIRKYETEKNEFICPFYLNNEQIGNVHYTKTEKLRFSKDEQVFLAKISEAVAITIDRIAKKTLSEQIKYQWESTFNSMSNPICIVDEGFKLVQFNKAFSSRCQIPKSKLINSHAISSFFGAEDHDLQNRLQQESLPVERAHALLDNQKSHFYQLKLSPLNLPDSPHKKYVLFFKDITHRKNLEEQLFLSSKMVEIGIIGSSIAHEINNPLGGMLSFLQLIQMDMRSDDPLNEDIMQMLDAGKRCKDIVENLLGFSRKSTIDFSQTCLLSDIIKGALQLPIIKAKYSNIHIEVSQPNAEITLFGDHNLLVLAFKNIIQNSVEAITEKASNEISFDGQIRIEVAASPQSITIIVSDNGISIPPHALGQIFNPLFTTKSHLNHSGLGLTIAYQIVDQHGGHIEVFSQPNSGTSIKVKFKRSRFQS